MRFTVNYVTCFAKGNNAIPIDWYTINCNVTFKLKVNVLVISFSLFIDNVNDVT